MLGELHLLGRCIPVEELALVGLDFLPLFKTQFVEQVSRGSLIGRTEAGLDFGFVSAKYKCANSPEGTFVRFAQRPRRWVYVTPCATGGEVGVPVPAVTRHLAESTGPQRLNDIAALTEPNEGEVAERQTITNQIKQTGDYPTVCDFAAFFQISHARRIQGDGG